MAEYIEKKYLLDFLDAVIESEEDLNAQITAKAIKASINVMPPFNMKERKTGRWIAPEDLICYKCSACGMYANQGYGLDEPIFWDYCPNCGADMRGRKDG